MRRPGLDRTGDCRIGRLGFAGYQLAIAAILCSAHSHWACTGRAQTSEPIELSEHLDAINAGALAPDLKRAVTGSSDHAALLWDLESQKVARRFEQHTGPVLSLAISGDNRMLVTGGQDNQARVWQLPPVAPTMTLGEPSATELEPSSAAIALGNNGSWLLWNSTGNTLSFVDPAATLVPNNTPFPMENSVVPSVQQRVVADPTNPASTISAVAVRPDGVWLAQGQSDGQVIVFSPFVDGIQARFQAQASSLIAIAFRSDNQRLVTFSKDGQWTLWQFAPRPQPQPEAVAAEPNAAEQAEPAPVDPNLGSSPWIVTAVRQGTVDIGEVRWAEAIGTSSQFLIGADSERVAIVNTDADDAPRVLNLESKPLAAASRADGQRVAVAFDQHIKLLQPANLEWMQTIELEAAPSSLAYTPDNQRLIVSSNDAGLRVYGAPQPAQPLIELVEEQRAPEARLMRVWASSDNRAVWGLNREGQVERWSLVSPRQIFQLNHGGAVYSLALNRDGSRIVSCGADQQVRVFDGTNGQQRFALSGHQGAVLSVAMSADEAVAVSSGADGTLRMWDIVGGRAIKQIAKFDQSQYALAIDSSGRFLATCGADRLVHLFDFKTGNELGTCQGHRDYVNALAFDPTGERVASYGYAGELRVWRVSDRTLLWQTKVASVGTSVSYSPDGSRLLLTSGDGVARVIELPAEAK